MVSPPQSLIDSDTDDSSIKTDHINFHDLPTPQEPNVPLPPPSVNPTVVLDIDKITPDKHVPRDPRLIRLTGVHPFNVEPPLTALYKEGSCMGFSQFKVS